MQPTHASIAHDSAVTALQRIPELLAVATDPTTPALVTVAADPTTPALIVVAVEPYTATLDAVAREPISVRMFSKVGDRVAIRADFAATTRRADGHTRRPADRVAAGTRR